MTDELPTGWAELTLDQAGKWRTGGTPSRHRPEFFGKGVPWVKSGDLPDGPILKTEEEITELGLDVSSAKLMPTGTISMALYGATIGKLEVMTFPAATNQACANVIPDNRLVESTYLFYYLLSERRNFIEQGQGGAQPNISQKIVRTHPFRLAPLPEQRRIVAKLEKLLGKVDACQQRLAKIPILLKRFRQSVLAAACSGRLTADWREENEGDSTTRGSIESSDELFPLPETWRWRALESVCDKIVDCPHSTPKWTDSGRLCARTTNFKPGFLDLSEVRYVSEATFSERMERLRPKPGDVLYSREGGILGIACMIPANVELCLGQRMMLFRTKSDFTATLLMHWLNSPVILRRVQELTGGSASPHLNVRDIKAFPTPVSPLSEQHEIVRRVEQLFLLADQIETRFTQARAQVDKLTPSFLARAFRGELVPQDPNDELAEKLLDRIRKAAENDEKENSKKDRRA